MSVFIGSTSRRLSRFGIQWPKRFVAWFMAHTKRLNEADPNGIMSRMSPKKKNQKSKAQLKLKIIIIRWLTIQCTHTHTHVYGREDVVKARLLASLTVHISPDIYPFLYMYLYIPIYLTAATFNSHWNAWIMHVLAAYTHLNQSTRFTLD